MNDHKRSNFVKFFDSHNDLQIDRLKDLLLVNFELIQHQEALISSNNSTIQALLNENELLKLRLEKVERKLKLNKNENSKKKCKARKSDIRPTPTSKNKFHQKSINGMPKLIKEETSSSIYEISISTPPNIQSDLIADNSNDTLIQTSYNDMTNDVGNDVHLNDSNFIAVPNWRMRPMHTLYVMEGTENLDDHVFERRHQKPENDERRRKRWDLQRLRELGLIKKNSHRQDHEIDDSDNIRVDAIEIDEEVLPSMNSNERILRNATERKVFLNLI